MECDVCRGALLNSKPYSVIEGVPYHECLGCGSIYVADEKAISRDNAREYNQQYWESEISSSRSRSYGSTIARIAEIFLYARVPIERFIDIGCGPGFSLDAVSTLMPYHKDIFWGVEMYPPPEPYRSRSPNYMIGSVGSCNMKFSAGICIEVIEHLHPWQLRKLVSELAGSAQEESVFYFNSSQPARVKNNDPGYLDPYRRGHVASYSLEGLRHIFGENDFNIIPLYGRDWAFLAEYKSKTETNSPSELLERIWTANEENLRKLQSNGFGPLMHTIGIESARCYLEAAIAIERTDWAISLDKRLKEAKDSIPINNSEVQP